MQPNFAIVQLYLNEIECQLTELEAVVYQLQERNDFYPLTDIERKALTIREATLKNTLNYVFRGTLSVLHDVPFDQFPIAKLLDPKSHRK